MLGQHSEFYASSNTLFICIDCGTEDIWILFGLHLPGERTQQILRREATVLGSQITQGDLPQGMRKRSSCQGCFSAHFVYHPFHPFPVLLVCVSRPGKTDST